MLRSRSNRLKSRNTGSAREGSAAIRATHLATEPTELLDQGWEFRDQIPSSYRILRKSMVKRTGGFVQQRENTSGQGTPKARCRASRLPNSPDDFATFTVILRWSTCHYLYLWYYFGVSVDASDRLFITLILWKCCKCVTVSPYRIYCVLLEIASYY